MEATVDEIGTPAVPVVFDDWVAFLRRQDSSVIVTGPTRAVVDLVWATIERRSVASE